MPGLLGLDLGEDPGPVLAGERGEAPADIQVTWAQLDLAPQLKAQVHDLWSGRKTRGVSGAYGGRVAPHGVIMVRVTPAS